MHVPDNSIFKVVLLFSQQIKITKFFTKLGFSSEKRSKGRIAVGTEALKNIKNQIIPLSNDDIASQTKMALQSKEGKLDKANLWCL